MRAARLSITGALGVLLSLGTVPGPAAATAADEAAGPSASMSQVAADPHQTEDPLGTSEPGTTIEPAAPTTRPAEPGEATADPTEPIGPDEPEEAEPIGPDEPEEVAERSEPATDPAATGIPESAPADSEDVDEPVVIRYVSNPSELFVVAEDGSATKLTLTDWYELGSPQPETIEARFLKSPWSSTIYHATPSASQRLDAATWRRAGEPSPASALVGLARLPWSTSVYGQLSYAYDRAAPATASSHLTLAQWQRLTPAERTTLRTVPAVPGSEYFAWSTNSRELFVTPPDGSIHHLTYAQWSAAGTPSVTQKPGGFVKAPWSSTLWRVDSIGQAKAGTRVTPAAWRATGSPTPLTQVRVPGTDVYRWSSNGEQIFAELPDGVTHHYTLSEWQRAGSPGPRTRAGGFYRVPWASTIWYYPQSGSTAGASALTFAEYQSFAEPAPARVTSLPGGTYAKYWGDDQVRFTALGATSIVPFWGYAEAGYPTPRTEYARVFVYGTLRPGQSAWSLVSPSVEGTALGLVPGKSLYAAPSGRFPYMVPGGFGVTGTILRLQSSTYASTIARLDAYENYNPSKPAASQPYNRNFVTTSSGERVMTYQAGLAKAVEVRSTGRYIPSGDWLRR